MGKEALLALHLEEDGEGVMRNGSGGGAVSLSDTVVVAMVSSAFSVCVCQPVDVASRVAKKGSGNVVDAMGQVWRKSGFQGLFHGNQFQMLRKVPTKAVRVLTYEWSNVLLKEFRSMENGVRLSPLVENALVSSFAASFSVAVTYPLHLLHICHTKKLKFSDVIRRGWFRGLKPLALSAVPSVTMELFLYNGMRDAFPGTEGDLGSLMAMSIAARLVGETIGHPLKLVSKKIVTSKKTRGVRKTASAILQKSGPGGLFKGVQYRYLKSLLSLVTAKFVAGSILPTSVTGPNPSRYPGVEPTS